MTRAVDHVLATATRLGLTADERETVARLLISTDRPQAGHADLGLTDADDCIGADL